MRAGAFAKNAQRAADHLAEVAPGAQREYAGRFEEYTFFLRARTPLRANRNRNDRIDRLVAITPSLFQIDRESQVEFLRDAAGAVTAIRILWNDGWVDRIERAAP